MTSPADDPTFRTAVARQLDSFVADQRVLLTEVDPAVGDLVQAAVDFTVGGKLFRPTFCHAGWLLAGGSPADPRIAAAGAAFEWLQGSALVHDDLMDGSDTRRGRPSVHRDFEARHVAAGAVGDPEQYGARVAILLGDLMLSWADEHFRRAEPDSRTALLWDACKSEVVSGQFLDVLTQTRETLDVASAMHVIRFKSAKYTIERPLHVGAALAGGDDTLLSRLTDVALPLGEAFQLRDDVLGVFGDPADTGKPAGDDLREGKRTVLVARTADVTGDARVLSLLGRPEGVDELRDLIEASGALTEVERDIDRLVAQAERAIAVLGDEAAAVLDPLVDAATRRVR
ncbi:polyprenyl synthetase family protein [Aeromicrobium duanguangcaii]|uniref:Polyprenyl synthetase family protein n=1 Tax=Aeromicrobium duanguangcaii TaxID=2968086 RepID=A0ABY5KIP8_9ACTN|nr:polyprenyl synthetase family protein [Aeromicrobium duanguangcaii]MCD9153270.1 polyprenyl synthetase family protein [Aeromicrobium duanguangcaii]UUI69633.1 polyprenyl synthetase family protein [Aeromicrobium duanguangcaii]